MLSARRRGFSRGEAARLNHSFLLVFTETNTSFCRCAMMADNKDWGFRDQIQRAAVSIMNNIAEGFESGSDAKFINFLNISKGSCSEVRSMLYLCKDQHFCTPEKFEELRQQSISINNQLYKFIQYLNNKPKD